jgi:hypothetical protein
MREAVLCGPRDIRSEDRETPTIVEPTDAVIRIAVTCVCGSDLWPYRGLQPIDGPSPMGHEYRGIVEEVGSAVKSIKPGQFVIGSFATSDNMCPNCQYVVVHAPPVHDPGASANPARAAGRRDAGADAGRSVGRPAPEPTDNIGCSGHRLVRCRRGECEAGINRRGRRRWRSRPARRSLGQASRTAKRAISGLRPHRTVRSQLSPPEGRSFEPTPLRAPSKALIT